MAICFEPRDHDNVRQFPLAAAQTIAEGDMTTINTDGFVEIATAASAKLLGPAARGTSVSNSTEGDKIAVHCDPDAVFRCKCDNASQNLQAKVGDEVDLIGTTGAQFVDLDASATDVFVVQELGSFRDPTGLSDSTQLWCDGKELFVKINRTKHCLA